MPFATIEEAAELYRRGQVVIIVDDEDRENEGDLCIAAEKVTPESVNFMARYGRGLICLALTEERCDELDLPLMVEHNTSNYGTAFTVSIEARGRVTTGISAHDRAETVRVAIDPRTKPADLLRPGHVFPLRAKKGGVLKRAGQTEASVDLAHDRRHDSRRGDLRNHERGRHDGAPAGPARVRRPARPEDHLGRRHHQVPDADREARALPGLSACCRRRTASSAFTRTRATSPARSTWRW